MGGQITPLEFAVCDVEGESPFVWNTEYETYRRLRQHSTRINSLWPVWKNIYLAREDKISSVNTRNKAEMLTFRENTGLNN